jgi:hypothetical protein
MIHHEGTKTQKTQGFVVLAECFVPSWLLFYLGLSGMLGETERACQGRV